MLLLLVMFVPLLSRLTVTTEVRKRGSHCLYAFSLFLCGATGVTAILSKLSVTVIVASFNVLFFEVHLRALFWGCFMFTFGVFTVITAHVVECFLCICTGRASLACETSVMQQLLAHTQSYSVFRGGRLCTCFPPTLCKNKQI